MSLELDEVRSTTSHPSTTTLLTPFQLGTLLLPNRIVMSPMTRARSTHGIPATIEAEDTVEPRALTIAEIQSIVDDYRIAAVNAKSAGFDGVEVHGGNVYLIPQFLNTSTNHRQDEYGGSPENRARIVLQVLIAVGTVWEHHRIGIKLSPTISGVGTYAAMEHILQWLSGFAPAYLHLRRGFDTNGNPIEMLREHAFDHFREIFKGVLIGNGGFDLATANAHVERGNVDLVSFARHFISNPDLVSRFRKNQALASSDPATYYTGR